MSLIRAISAAALATACACGGPTMPPDPTLIATDSAEARRNPSPVRELEVEHNGCFGQCPVYRVKLSDDGAWEWEGKRFVSQVGRKTGSMYPTELSPLFGWLRDHPALYAADDDRTDCCDLESLTFRFGLKSGRSVVVEYSLGLEGDDLWALSSIVDGIIARALIPTQDKAEHERRPAT